MDYIIIGCGLSGSIVARELANAGKTVEIWEKRNHIAGNLYDYVDSHNILVQKYGPHIFHTNNDRVWQYINEYGDWKPFKLVCGASWDNKYTPTAFNFKTIDIFYDSKHAKKLKDKLKTKYPNRLYVNVVEILNSDDKDIKSFGQFLFENDYAPYTAKQWGIPVNEVDQSVLKRVPIRLSYDECYFNDKYEVMPKESYTHFIENIIKHKNIRISLNTDALKRITIIDNKICIDGHDLNNTQIIYTGPIDELLKYKYGKLPYRSLQFEWKYEDIDSFQEAPVVAYPKAKDYTRITEYKKLPIQLVRGTTYSIEYPIPYDKNKSVEPYYPVLTADSFNQYEKYLNEIMKIKNITILGRLADFKYYNMDQTIERALSVSEKLLNEENIK